MDTTLIGSLLFFSWDQCTRLRAGGIDHIKSLTSLLCLWLEAGDLAVPHLFPSLPERWVTVGALVVTVKRDACWPVTSFFC